MSLLKGYYASKTKSSRTHTDLQSGGMGKYIHVVHDGLVMGHDGTGVHAELCGGTNLTPVVRKHSKTM